jgi:N-dimethylarginine dimethylaminohydrolase
MSDKARFLMCPPDHFDVVYEINPWMMGQKPVDKALAMSQWEHLRKRISERAIVELMASQPGLPDMVFTANAGAVAPRCVVTSRFVPRERQPEEAHFKTWFRERGLPVMELDDCVGFEGAGDCLADSRGQWYWAAYGFRTQREAHPCLAACFGSEVVSLRLVDERFYHLDTCLSPLRGGYLMYFPGAFDSGSLKAIHARVPARYRIEIDEDDACRFACNAVNIEERIILNAASARVQVQLEQLGFVVEQVDLSEFIKAGGSAKCLVLQLA